MITNILVRFPAIAAMLVLTLTASAQEPLFEVVKPADLAFHYPDPPKEGAADFFPLAENGESRCVIVQPASTSSALRAAIREFSNYLALVTGADMRVVDDGREILEGLGTIQVGDTVKGKTVKLALPDLQFGDEVFTNRRGFLVHTPDPSTLVIRGPDEEATKHGLVGFLKRYAGVRQYWYGPVDGLGNVIPARPTLKIPQVEWRDWPYMVSFQMSLRSFGRRPYLDFYRRRKALPCSENYNRWLPPGKYAKSHPEYYAQVNGKRLQPTDAMKNKGWQPCVSNPAVQKVMGEAVIDFFHENRDAPGINVAINDGGGDCTCANCRALDAPGTDYSRGHGMSERYIHFSNRICEIVGREFPDKWIVYLAYANASAAPKIVTPHPRLLPVTTTASTFQRWDEWIQSGAKHLGAYTHHLGTFALLPKMDARQQAKRIRYLIGSEKMRTYYMECHTQWPHADVIPYITAELLWDPRQDVDALLDEYFGKFYRSAKGPMRDYYSILRKGYERWLEAEGRTHWFGKDVSSYHQNKTLEQFRVLSPTQSVRAAEALDRAVTAASGDDLVTQRINIIQQSFALQKMAIERAWAAYRLRDTKPETETEAHDRIADARLIYQRHTDARKHIESVLEKPPLDQWKLYRISTRPLDIYNELKSGEPGPEMLSIISLGLFSTEEYLRRKLGGNAAAAWWRSEAEKETVPALKTAYNIAAERALAPEPENLVSDPGFEEIAEEQEEETVLTKDQTRAAGVRLTFPDRTPWRCLISSSEVKSGKAALVLEHCARARFSRHIRAEADTRYRAGLWFRQDDGISSPYTFSIDVRLEDGGYQTLSTLTIPPVANVWRQFVADVVTPPNTVNLFVRLHVQNQAAGTRCWIDDVIVVR